MGLGIVWFILSIEFTIYWNDIKVVNSINSTSQLIPFVIGCVTISQTLKKTALLGLTKICSIHILSKREVYLNIVLAYPDWEKVRLEVRRSISGLIFVKIVKRNDGGNGN